MNISELILDCATSKLHIPMKFAWFAMLPILVIGYNKSSETLFNILYILLLESSSLKKQYKVFLGLMFLSAQMNSFGRQLDFLTASC